MNFWLFHCRINVNDGSFWCSEPSQSQRQAPLWSISTLFTFLSIFKIRRWITWPLTLRSRNLPQHNTSWNKKEVCQIYKECHIFLKGKDASALLGGCDVDWAVGCHQHLRILNSNLVVANFLQTCKSEENDPYLKI